MSFLQITCEQARIIDQWAIEKLGVPSVVLMENAGRNAADCIDEFLKEKRGTIAVVAGSGNNGGDGFVIARHLANRGMSVTTFLVAPEEKIKGDARINLDILRALGHDVFDISAAPSGLAAKLGGYSLIVDAIGGTGVSGALHGYMADAVRQINYSGRTIVSIDMPTGLDCDTGKAEGPVVKAAMTVTFIAVKIGFCQPGASEYTGEVVVADIGIGSDVIASTLDSSIEE